jgi:TolB-like protein
MKCFTMAVLIASLAARAAHADDVQFKTLAASLRSNLPDASQRKVAVTDFTDLRGNVTELGRYLAEELSIALASTGPGVVDRTHLRALLQENKLATTGIIDPATARQLGKIAGVHTLVTGSLTPFGDTVRLALKALDTETAEIIWATGVDLPRTKGLVELGNLGISMTNGPTPSRPEGERTAPAPATLAKTVAGQFLFEIKRCSFSDSAPEPEGNYARKFMPQDKPADATRRAANSRDVICTLSITNLSEDASIGISGGDTKKAKAKVGSTRMFDNLGNEYQVSQIWLGNHHGAITQSLELISDIRTSAAIQFDNVAGSADRIAVLDIFGQARGQGYHAQIRNIPISR